MTLEASLICGGFVVVVLLALVVFLKLTTGTQPERKQGYEIDEFPELRRAAYRPAKIFFWMLLGGLALGYLSQVAYANENAWGNSVFSLLTAVMLVGGGLGSLFYGVNFLIVSHWSWGVQRRHEAKWRELAQGKPDKMVTQLAREKVKRITDGR